MNRLSKHLVATVVLLGASLGVAHAAAVTPVSYSFDQATSCGSWCYHDAALTKLTDGVVGNAGWAINQGAEWVGWVYKPAVNIDFVLSGVTAVDTVSIGSTQDSLGDVALPSFAVSSFENGNWVQKGVLTNSPSNANNNDPYSTASHLFYTLSNLNIHSDKVRVTAYANGPWTFVDEVRITSAVPEPETYAMLIAGLGVVGAIAKRRKAK